MASRALSTRPVCSALNNIDINLVLRWQELHIPNEILWIYIYWGAITHVTSRDQRYWWDMFISQDMSAHILDTSRQYQEYGHIPDMYIQGTTHLPCSISRMWDFLHTHLNINLRN